MAILTQRDAQLLCGTFLFCGFSQEEVSRLLDQAGIGVEDFAAGEAIYTPEAFRRCLGVVLTGQATVHKRSAAGGAMLMSMLGPGALFGAAALFQPEQEAYVTEIQAKKPVRALLIPEADLKKLLQQDFRLTEHYLSYLTSRIHFLNARLEGLISPTVEERLMLFLSNQADETGSVQLHFSYTALAQTLCIGRASLYRALDALEAQGRICRGEGRKLTVCQA